MYYVIAKRKALNGEALAEGNQSIGLFTIEDLRF